MKIRIVAGGVFCSIVRFSVKLFKKCKMALKSSLEATFKLYSKSFEYKCKGIARDVLKKWNDENIMVCEAMLQGSCWKLSIRCTHLTAITNKIPLGHYILKAILNSYPLFHVAHPGKECNLCARWGNIPEWSFRQVETSSGPKKDINLWLRYATSDDDHCKHIKTYDLSACTWKSDSFIEKMLSLCWLMCS